MGVLLNQDVAYTEVRQLKVGIGKEQVMSEQFDTDVLVVGTGPAGSTLGLALASYGIKVQLFTQFSWLANSPRAHITNQRAMEVLRDLGVEKQVKQIATPWE